MFSFFSSFVAAVSCFLCKIHGICPLFCDGCVVNQDTCMAYVFLHVEQNVHLALVLVSLCCHQIYPLQCQLVLLKNKKRHSDCGCLKILTLIITVLPSVMRMHPRYEFCGGLHVTYLVLVRTLLTWSKCVPDSDACIHEYIPWFTPYFHLLYSWI
jgi:hypothetical protein